MRNRIIHIGFLIGLLFIGTVGRGQTISLTVSSSATASTATSTTVCEGNRAFITVKSNVIIYYYLEYSTYNGSNWTSWVEVPTSFETDVDPVNTGYINKDWNPRISLTTKYRVKYYFNTSSESINRSNPQYLNDEISITLFKTPIFNLPQLTTICSGQAFHFTPTDENIVPLTGTLFTWNAVNNGIVSGSSTNTTAVTVISETLVSNTNTNTTAVYRVTPISSIGSCPGTPFDLNVIVKPTPSINQQTTEIFSGETFTVTPVNGIRDGIVPDGTVYTWLAPTLTGQPNEITGGTSGSGNVITGTLTNTTTSVQYATYTVTASAGNCTSTTFTVRVKIKPRPSIANNPYIPQICNGSAFVFTPPSAVPTGTQYSWTVQDVANVSGEFGVITPTVFSQTLSTTSTNASVNIDYVVTPIADGCAGPNFNATVNLIPSPVINPGLNTDVCSGGDLRFTPENGSHGIVPAGTMYTWTIGANPNVTDLEPQSTQQNRIFDNVITKSVNDNTPEIVYYNVTTHTVGCTSTTFTLTVNIVPGATIGNKNDEIISGQNPSITPGQGYPGDIVLTGTRYTWTIADNPSITGFAATTTPTTSINQILTNQSNTRQLATYYATSVANTCASASFIANVYVLPKPKILQKLKNTNSNSPFSISISDNSPIEIVPDNTFYTWSAPAGTASLIGVVSATDAGSISGTYVNLTNTIQTTTYSVTPTYISPSTRRVDGAPFSVTVSVYPRPKIGPKVATICSGGTFSVTITDNSPNEIVPANTTYSWSAPTITNSITGGVSATNAGTISGTLINQSAGVQTATYTVIPISGTAEGDPFTVTVTVNPKASILPNFAAAVCTETPFTFTQVDNDIIPTGTTYTWSIPSATGSMTGGASGSNAATISGTLTNPTNEAQTAIYTITPQSGSCIGGNFTMTATVNPKATIQNITLPSRCSGLSFSATPTHGSGNILPTGTTFSWSSPSLPALLTGGASGTATNTISGLLINASSNTLTATYTITPLSGTCQGGNFTLTAGYFPLPASPTVVDKVVNYNTNPQGFNVSVPNGQVIRWYNPIETELTGSAAPPTYTNANVNPYIVYVAAENTTTHCVSENKVPAKLTIGKIVLTFNNSMTALDKVYDATNTATLTNTSLVGVLGNDLNNLTLHIQASFPDKNVGNSRQVTETSYIDGIAAGNYSLTNTVGLTASITPKTIQEVNATYPTSKVYDGTDLVNGYLSNLMPTELPGTGVAATDRKPYQGDDITITSVAKYTDRVVGNTKTVTSYSTLTGLEVNNYTLLKQNLTAANITRKSLMMTGLSVPASKVYDGTTDANVTDAKTLLASEPDGSGTSNDGKYYTIDEGQVSLTGTPIGTYNSKDVATANIVNFSNLSLTGASAGNYTLTIQAGANATISKKALTFTGLSVPSSKVYNGNASAIVTGTPTLETSEPIRTGSTTDGIPYNIDVVSLTGSPTANYNTKDVLTANTVSFSGVVLTGAQSSNYSLTAHLTQTANITAKTISVTGAVAKNKIYDATNIAEVINGQLQGVESIDASTVTLTQSGVFANKNVANGITVTSTCSLAGTDSPNYILSPPILAPKNITPKELTMYGLAIPASKVYDATIVASITDTKSLQTAQAPGRGTTADGKPYTGDNVTITGTPVGNYNSKDVPSASKVGYSGLGLTGAEAGNYTLKIQDSTIATITKKKLTMSGLSVASSKVYDGNKSALVLGSPTLQSKVPPGTGDALDGKPYSSDDIDVQGDPIAVYNTKDVATANSVKFSGLVLTGAQFDNYDLTIQSDYPATIIPLTINIKADAKTKVYGEDDPAFTYVNDPIILGDEFVGNLSRVIGQNVGSYSITQGSLDLGTNYTIIYHPDNLVITEASLYIKPDTTYRIYGDAPLLDGLTSDQFVATGLQYNETIRNVRLYFPMGAGSGNDPKDPIGLYSFGVKAKDPSGGSALASNYKIVSFPGDIRVRPFPITITAEAKEKRQSQLDPPLTYTLSRNPVNGDTVSGALYREPGDEAGTYPIKQGTVKINDNYDITYVPNLFTVLTIESLFILPNAFSPNGDDLNDKFRILYNSSVSSINYFRIYNKAGKLVFETKNINDYWDGRLNGVMQDSDAYYWIAEFKSWDNKIFQRKGSVVLVK